MILGTSFPNFDVETTMGKMKLHDYQGKSWLLFMSHPNDFTPICTTELTHVANIYNEFQKRNIKIIGMSCDPIEDHHGWMPDLMKFVKAKNLPFPIIADPNREIAFKFGMMDPIEKDKKGRALTARAFLLIDPNYKLRIHTLYPAPVGRDFSEILRSFDALKLSLTGKYMTPVNWKQGEKVLPAPNMPDSKFKKKIDKITLPSGKNYMRYVELE